MSFFFPSKHREMEPGHYFIRVRGLKVNKVRDVIPGTRRRLLQRNTVRQPEDSRQIRQKDVLFVLSRMEIVRFTAYL